MLKKTIFPLLLLSAIIAIVLSIFLPDNRQYDSSQYPWQGFYYLDAEHYFDTFNLPQEVLDKESFTIISDGLAYDKNNIYYFSRVIDENNEEKIAQLRQDLYNRYTNSYHGPQKNLWDYETFQILDLDGAIARDKNSSFFGGYQLKTPTDKLQTLGNDLYTDGEGAIYNGNDLLALDIDQLVIDKNYLYDHKNVYFKTFFKNYAPLAADATSFTVLNDNFAKDKHHYFFHDEKLLNIDYKSFKAFNRHAVDKNRAYYFLNSSQISITYSIDYDSYEEIGNDYAKDKNHLYFQGTRVNNIDPQKVTQNEFGTFHDGKHVISGSYIVMNANLNSYRRYKNMGYATDKRSIYYGDQKIPGSDGATFKFITHEKYGKAYVKDQYHVYKEGKIIEGADPTSLEVLSGDWLKDKNAIFYGAHQIFEADLATFEVIDAELARDKNYLYSTFAGSYNINPNIKDPQSFQLVESFYYKDQEQVYYLHGSEFFHLPGVDPQTFEYLGINYSKDKNNVYYKVMTPIYTHPFIVDTDPASFKVIELPLGSRLAPGGKWRESYNRDYAKDVKGCFTEGYRDQCPKEDDEVMENSEQEIL